MSQALAVCDCFLTASSFINISHHLVRSAVLQRCRWSSVNTFDGSLHSSDEGGRAAAWGRRCGFPTFSASDALPGFINKSHAFVARFRFTQVRFWKRGKMKAKTVVECSIFHQNASLWQFVRSLVAGCVAPDWLNLHKVELWLWLCKFWHGAQLVRLPRRTHRALRGSISFRIDRFVWLCHGRSWHNCPAAYFTLLCRSVTDWAEFWANKVTN